MFYPTTWTKRGSSLGWELRELLGLPTLAVWWSCNVPDWTRSLCELRDKGEHSQHTAEWSQNGQESSVFPGFGDRNPCKVVLGKLNRDSIFVQPGGSQNTWKTTFWDKNSHYYWKITQIFEIASHPEGGPIHLNMEPHDGDADINLWDSLEHMVLCISLLLVTTKCNFSVEPQAKKQFLRMPTKHSHILFSCYVMWLANSFIAIFWQEYCSTTRH